MRKLIVAVMILTFAIPVPALAQVPGGAADQYGTAGETVAAEGTVQKAGITTYQYGTHVLMGESGDLLFALRSDTVALDDYVGERVTLQGIRVPGYQNGAVEGGPDLLEVTRIGDGSPVQPPDEEPGADAPGTGGSSGSSSGSKDAAATGVLPDTGGATGRETDGISVAALLLINAVLLGSALLVRRIVG
ncbi:MAG TPA: hypothetical protein VHM16_06135 [Rubrobacteraceae bacterium]|nr:hypothetical protein [Rubrobacteraceae bacterium]